METIIVAIISAVSVIATTTIQTINAVRKDSIHSKLDNITKQIDKVAVDNLKNFMSRCLDDVEQGNKLGATTLQRFWESYDKYTNEYKQNSYIHARVDEALDKGFLKPR